MPLRSEEFIEHSYTHSHLVKLHCCVLLDPSLCWLLHVEVLLQRHDKDSLYAHSLLPHSIIQADPRHMVLSDVSMTSA